MRWMPSKRWGTVVNLFGAGTTVHKLPYFSIWIFSKNLNKFEINSGNGFYDPELNINGVGIFGQIRKKVDELSG
jgi:hypothetical protein